MMQNLMVLSTRARGVRPSALALLLLLQLHAALGTGSSQPSSTDKGPSILHLNDKSIKILSQGKLRGFELDKGDPNAPILQELAPIGALASGSKQIGIKRLPARFIVQLAAKPAAAALAEHNATPTASAAPHRSQRVQALAQAVVSQVDTVAAAADVTAKVVRKYTHALAGFAVAGLTPVELKALAANPDVVAIWADVLQKLTTYTTPEFLGLTSKQGENPHADQAELSAHRPPKGPSYRSGRQKPTDGVGGGYQYDHHQGWHKGNHQLPGDNNDTDGSGRYPYEKQQHGYDHYDKYGNSGYEHDDGGYGHKDYSQYGPGGHGMEPVWDQLGGVVGPHGAGEDVVVGVIDSGVWMEDHPSFADKDYWNTDGYGSIGQTYAPLARWKGICQPGNSSTPFGCNNKVIGCRWYNLVWEDLLLDFFPYESLSCQDENGHGTHTAATAAGNYGAVSPFAPPGALLSGMAPRARIAMYKPCWGREEFFAGCWPVDTIAAIDDAIKDGVNILSVSLGSPASPSFASPMDLVYLNAAAFGIFISVAAGNDGPDEGTVTSFGPWYTSVAASSQPRSVNGSAILGDGQRLWGSAPAKQPASGPFPLIYGGDAAIDTTVYAAQCETDSLDATLVEGHVVICDYGPYSNPQDQSKEVVRAGGVGLIAAVTPEVQYTSRASPREYKLGIPYVQVGPPGREAALTYVWSNTRPTVSFGAAEFSFHNTAPEMALFSSRGPAVAVQQLVLKPDITAPGLNIHAATSPKYPPANVMYDTYAGTSMSCPHISGIAALLLNRHPTWTPMEIKSAIMTTAYQLTKTGAVGKQFGTAIDYGAGHVDAQRALSPGLVIQSTYEDWLDFLCQAELVLGNSPPEQCPTVTGSVRQLLGAKPPTNLGEQAKPIDPRCVNRVDLNTPSVSGIVAGAMTVRRTLTAVLDDVDGAYSGAARSVHFESTAGPDAGSSFDIRLWPPEFSMSNGQEVSILISISARTDTPMNKVQTGQIVWHSHTGHRVAIPVAVTFTPFIAHLPKQLTLPAIVGGSSSYSYRISSSVTQSVKINSGVQAGALYTGTAAPEKPATFSFVVPPRTAYLAFALFSEDYPAGTDLDLLLYSVTHAPGNCSETKRELQAVSNGFTSTEFVYGSAITPGEYEVIVKAYTLVNNATSIDVYLLAWVIDEYGSGLETGLLSVTPDRLHMVAPEPCCCQVTATVTGYDASGDPVPNRYIGVIKYVSAAQQVMGNTTVLMF